MTYFNEAIYNIDNLKEQDKQEIKTADFIAENVISCLKGEYEEIIACASSTLEKINAECKLEALKDVARDYDSMRLELIVSVLDGYEEGYNVEEKEEWNTWDNPFEVEEDIKIPHTFPQLK